MAMAIQEARRVVKLYSCEFESVQTVREGYSIILEHPATFEKLAMDPELKRILKEDLDRFVKRKEWYKKVGRAWKRGYLIYGPLGVQSTLSGLLNVIDGLWSNNGNGRIIVFTTNHKDQLDQLDPALLRSGRMDMRVNMSYCSMYGFKQLASTYLDINGDHQLYGQIEPLFEKVEVTPAEIAEELSRTEDTDFALRGVVELLEEKTKKKELENAMSM
ncbi:AAA-ATPase At2g18190-like [Quercus lobata]|uniref:AAA-ATPase At2g18190-like n=1 Tax=Quercus lobata TaxID=97700 RepID=UPI0012449F5F|nr:AAA-ATPase At2g18190-like [Quercus lobata]